MPFDTFQGRTGLASCYGVLSLLRSAGIVSGLHLAPITMVLETFGAFCRGTAAVGYFLSTCGSACYTECSRPSLLSRLECDLGQAPSSVPHPTLDVGNLHQDLCGLWAHETTTSSFRPSGCRSTQEGHCRIIWVGLHALDAWSHGRNSTIAMKYQSLEEMARMRWQEVKEPLSVWSVT